MVEDNKSSGPLKKAGQLDKSGWFLIVRSHATPWLWIHVVWNRTMNIILTIIQP
jgi:hypothetical protein